MSYVTALKINKCHFLIFTILFGVERVILMCSGISDSPLIGRGLSRFIRGYRSALDVITCFLMVDYRNLISGGKALAVGF